MSETSSTALTALLEARYGVGPQLAAEYVHYFEWSQNVKLRGIADWESLDPLRRMWFDHAFSANRAGEMLAAVLDARLALAGRRVIEIGCGFAGFLVAAARRGALCAGIERDPLHLGFGRANLADFAADALVLDLDPLDAALADRLGRFDIVVLGGAPLAYGPLDPLLRSAARLLAAGGLVYAQIPNRDSVRFVARDGSFGLFGIVQLAPEDASRYHWDRFHWHAPQPIYPSLDECLAGFRAAGLRPEIVPSIDQPVFDLPDLAALLDELDAARAAFDTPDAGLRGRIAEACARYRERLSLDRDRLAPADFRTRYLRDFWTFLAAPE